MKITDISVNSNIIQVDLNNLPQSSIFFCNDIYSTNAGLVLQFPNTVLPVNSVISMQFIFNNVKIGANRAKFIEEVRNGSGLLPSKWNNLDTPLTTSHFIKQTVEIKYNSVLNRHECLHVIERFDEYQHPLVSDISLVTIHSKANENIYMLHEDYYELSVSSDQSNNRISVGWNIDQLMGKDLESSEFDRYVVNIYDEEGILEDTSGNETETNPSFHYTTTDASFSDWVVTVNGQVIERPIKVFKSYQKWNDDQYRFVFSDLPYKYRIKGLVLQQENQGTIAKISNFKYRYNSSSNVDVADTLKTYIHLQSSDMIQTQSMYTLNAPTLMSETLVTLDREFIGKITLLGDIYNK
jgi:hypothetical protein